MTHFTNNYDYSLTDDDVTQSKLSQKSTDTKRVDIDDDSRFILLTLDGYDENETEPRRRHLFDHEQVNLEAYQLIWCDTKIEDLTVTTSELRKIVDYTKKFANVKDCLQYIAKSSDTVTFFVCSDDFAELIVSEIHDRMNIRSIYIYCQGESFDEQKWTHFSKIGTSYHDLSMLLHILAEDVNQYMEQEKGAIFGEFALANESTDGSASWWPTFIQILCNLPYPKNSFEILLSTLRNYYQDNMVEQNKLNEFEKTYTPETAVWWYTRDTFFYRLLNKALRQHNIKTMFLFGFCVKDIYEQLKKEHEKLSDTLVEEPIYRVYRGQMMSLEEIQNLEYTANPNKYVSTKCSIVVNSLFSTTTDRTLAQLMLNSLINQSDELQNVLFEIELDIRNESLPFGNISHLSNFASEDEVLLMAGTELQIVQVIFDDENKTYIMKSKLNECNITTTDDNLFESTEQEILKNCLNQALKGHFLVDPEDLDIIFDGLSQVFPDEAGWFEAFKYRCLAHYTLIAEEDGRATFAFYRKAIEIYEMYLNNKDLNFAADIASIYYYVGGICATQMYDSSLAEKQYNLGIQCITSTLPITMKPKHLIELYNILSDLYQNKAAKFAKNEANEERLNAIKYRQLQLQEMLKYYSTDHIKLAHCFYDFAEQQKSISLFEEAVENFEKAIKIYLSQRWPKFDITKTIYKELSDIFITKVDNTYALYYKQKQIDTLKDHLKTDYHKLWKLDQLAACYTELADIYIKVNDLASANENLLLAKSILEDIEDMGKDIKIKKIDEKLEYIASFS